MVNCIKYFQSSRRRPNTYCSSCIKLSFIQASRLLACRTAFTVFRRQTPTVQPADCGSRRRTVFNDAQRSTAGLSATLTRCTCIHLELLPILVRHVAMDTRDVNRSSQWRHRSVYHHHHHHEQWRHHGGIYFNKFLLSKVVKTSHPTLTQVPFLPNVSQKRAHLYFLTCVTMSHLLSVWLINRRPITRKSIKLFFGNQRSIFRIFAARPNDARTKQADQHSENNALVRLIGFTSVNS